MKKILLLCMIILFQRRVSGQVALSYYPFHVSQLAFSTNTEKIAWADLRAEVNTFISNLNIELAGAINFKRTEVLNFYFAPGIGFNPLVSAVDISPLNGYYLNLGARIKPFSKNRNVHLIFELSPYVNHSWSSGNLRARLGLGYNFIRVKKNDA